MPLYLVQCQVEQRYVIAADAKAAFTLATKQWAAGVGVPDNTPMKTGHIITNINQVQADDPWK